MTEKTNQDGFILYPAIDLLGGKCVRLRQGDYEQATVYSNDPASMADSFRAAGASWIHIVDLDAARTGVPHNHLLIEKIARASGLNVQTGGGIRTMDTLDRVLGAGVSRAVLGTSAVRDAAFTRKAIEKYGSRIAIGIDARNGNVAVDGWTRESGVSALEFAGLMESIGAKTVIYTDILRDGMLTGTETDGIRRLVSHTKLNVIASGGIGSLEDILSTKAAGAAGAIVGKALYEGKVDLRECLQSVSSRALM